MTRVKNFFCLIFFKESSEFLILSIWIIYQKIFLNFDKVTKTIQLPGGGSAKGSG